MKVMTIVGTRPEIIKLSRVIPELDKYTEHVLIHTGQNYDYELNKIFFNEMILRIPDGCLMGESLGSVIRGISTMLEYIDSMLHMHQPDAVLVLGDTNSVVAAAYAAKRRKIPIFHMEAGNRCFDERVPEEVNRRIVDTISDINMPYTEHARRNLLTSGCPADRIIKTGSPMREVLTHYGEQIVCSGILERLSLLGQGYFVVSAHREENVDVPERLEALIRIINKLSGEVPVIFSVHPRTKKRITEANLMVCPNVEIHAPFGFFDYMQLQTNARCVISDSGTLTEEAEIQRFPAVQIRQAHERPEGSDAGTLIMADLVDERVLSAVRASIEQGPSRDFVADYAEDLVAQKVVRTILSYTDYVNRTVWRKG